MLDRDCPDVNHCVRHCWRQRRRQGFCFGLFIFPKFEFVIDCGSAALLDFGVNQINGQIVGPAPGGNEACGCFSGTQTGIADTAHGQAPAEVDDQPRSGV